MTVDQSSLQALKARGVELNPPVVDSDFQLLRSKLSIQSGEDFESVYRLFNGFQTHDGASMLMLWDINQIISSKHLYDQELPRLEPVPIGDYLIDSDIIIASISDEAARVSLLFEKRELARSMKEFISLLVAGEFDLH